MNSLEPLGRRLSHSKRAVAWLALALLFGIGIEGYTRPFLTPYFPFQGSDTFVPLVVQLEGAAEDQGLRVGDVIREVDRVPAPDWDWLNLLMRTKSPGSTLTLAVERGGEMIDLQVTSITFVDRLSHINPHYAIMMALLFLLSWFLIGLISWRRPRDSDATLFVLTGGVGLALLFTTDPVIGYGSLAWRGIYHGELILLTGLVGPLFLHLSLKYPVRVTSPRWTMPTVWTVSGLLTACSLIGFGTVFVSGPTATAVPFGVPACFRLTSVWDAVLALCGLAVFLRTYRRSLSHQRRLQVKWVLLGSAVTVVAVIVVELPYQIARYSLPRSHVLMILEYLALAALPLGIAVSVLRYRLFDADLYIERMGALVVLMLAVCLVRAAFEIPDWPAVSSEGAWGASMLVVAIPAFVLRKRWYRPLGVSGPSTEQIRADVMSAMLEGGSPGELSRRVLDRLATRLAIDRAAAFVREQGDFVCVHALGFATLPDESIAFDGSGTVAQWLRAENRPVRTVTYDRSAGIDLLTEKERGVLERLECAAIVPAMRNGQLVGFLVVGAHHDGAVPNSRLLRVLDQLAGDLATAISNSAAERATVTASAIQASPASRNVSEGNRVSFKKLGPYVLRDLLGRGSYGEVWRATHQPSQRHVALKVLHRETGSDPKALRRFREEIDALTGIDHPNVVRVLDFGNSEGMPWFAMEVIEGTTLRRRLDTNHVLSAREVVSVGLQVSRGLGALHAEGLIHRDLKPANILLSNGRVCLADLGLAYRISPEESLSLGRQTDIVGTILYMSPEQVSGRRLGAASDLFSLGSLLYECLAGVTPFEGTSIEETILQIRDTRYTNLEERPVDFPPALAAAVDSLLRLKEEDRPASAREVERIFRRLTRVLGAELRRTA